VVVKSSASTARSRPNDRDRPRASMVVLTGFS
jgi:hypothetical protein